MRVAIVYDWLDKWGGAERLLLYLKEIFPQAVFFASYWDREKAKWIKNSKVEESFLARFPKFIKSNRKLSLLFFPFVFESFTFDNFDLVISVTSYFSKAVITKPSTLHISYILTPPRFLWLEESLYFNKFTKKIFLPVLSYFRKWDFISAHRVDKVIVISKEVKKRVQKIYKIDPKVIYPPFDIEYWNKLKQQLKADKMLKYFRQVKHKKFFLFVGRLEPYKKVDLFIKVAKNFPEFQFIIVGKGSLEDKLKRHISKNVLFFKDLKDIDLAWLYSNAFGIIFPQKEEFGYVALESVFFDLPAIYYSKGGIKEILADTGVHFSKQEVSSLSKAVERSITLSYNLRQDLKQKKKLILERFSKAQFKKQIVNLISGLNLK